MNLYAQIAQSFLHGLTVINFFIFLKNAIKFSKPHPIYKVYRKRKYTLNFRGNILYKNVTSFCVKKSTYALYYSQSDIYLLKKNYLCLSVQGRACKKQWYPIGIHHSHSCKGAKTKEIISIDYRTGL